jgi:hypothetical protein
VQAIAQHIINDINSTAQHTPQVRSGDLTTAATHTQAANNVTTQRSAARNVVSAYVRCGDIEALVVGRVGVHRIFWAAWVLRECHRLCPRCGGVLEHREERAALKTLRCWRLRTDTMSCHGARQAGAVRQSFSQ